MTAVIPAEYLPSHVLDSCTCDGVIIPTISASLEGVLPDPSTIDLTSEDYGNAIGICNPCNGICSLGPLVTTATIQLSG